MGVLSQEEEQMEIQKCQERINKFLSFVEKEKSEKMKSTSTTQENTVSYNCPKCKDTGYIITKADSCADIMTPCDCQKINQAKSVIKNSGLSECFENMTFENYDAYDEQTKLAKEIAMKYVLSFDKIKNARKNSLLLCGQVGAGKTHLCMSVSNNLLNKGVSVLYMSYREAITKLKQNMLDEEYYNREISKYKRAGVLYIDDLFKGKVTESDVNIMFEIINYRYQKSLPIIVSTEYKIKRLLSFDEGIGSRIIEMCKSFTLEFSGRERNYRLR